MIKLKDLLKERNYELHARLVNNINKLETFLEGATLPYYTSHGLVHSESLINNFDKLIPDSIKREMGELEIFILLSSAYFHDIGMALKLSEKDSQKDFQTKKQYDKRLDFIRRTHSERIFRFLLHEENRREFDLDKGIASTLAKICKSHSDNKYKEHDCEYNGEIGEKKSKNWYDEYKEVPDAYKKGGIEYTFKDLLETKPHKAVNTHRVRIHFLAALLRLSDELDLGYKRAYENLREMPKISEFEHKKNHLVSGIDIESKKFEIAVDVFEEELYKGGKNSTAENNKALTEVIVKLREMFLEAKKTLNDNGLMYTQIKFRDPVIDRLQRTLSDDFNVAENSQVIYDDKEYGGALLYHLFYNLEVLDLSPEYIISNDIGFLFSGSGNFIDNCNRIFIKYKKNRSVSEIDTVPIEKEILKYFHQIYTSSLKDSDIENTDKLSENYMKVVSSIPQQILETIGKTFKEKIRYFLKKEETGINEKDFYVEGIQKEILANIIKDKYSYLRRKNFKEKAKNHFIYIVFSASYFLNIFSEMILEKIPVESRRGFLKDRLKQMNDFIQNEEHKNIKFYYHTNPLEEESKLLSSEVALENSITNDSIIIINDINISIDYYRRNVAFLKNMDTWRIKLIDYKDLKFKFVEADEDDDGFYNENKEYKDAFIKDAEYSIITLFSKIRGNWQ